MNHRCTERNAKGEKMDLTNVVADFAAVPYVKIGNGPRHPSNPDTSLVPDLADYLREHPFLRDYPDYVDFLECYAGASLNFPSGVYPSAFLFIFGIGRYFEEGLVDQKQSF